MHRATTILPLLLLLSATGACESLPELTRNTCGNRIIERGEDCDGAPIGNNTCNSACRLECGADLSCPPGWGCGADNLCREPNGGLAPLGSPVGLTATQLFSADFDGDRRNDLLAVNGVNIAVAPVDADGLLPTPTSIAVTGVNDAPNVPAVGDLDGDGQADLFIRSPFGLTLLRGQADRTFVPGQFNRLAGDLLGADLDPDDEVLWTDVDPRPGAEGFELLAVRGDGIYMLRNEHPDFEGLLPLKLYEWEGPKPHVSYERTYNASFILAAEGETQVTLVPVYNPLSGELNLGPTDQVTYTVTTPGPIGGPARLQVTGLENNSNHPSLVVTGEPDGSTPRLYVALCIDPFNFSYHSARTLDPPLLGDPQLEPDMTAVEATITVRNPDPEGDPLPLEGKPLFVGGIDNRDYDVDLVLDRGIFRTVCDEIGACELPAVQGDPLNLVVEPWLRPLSQEGWTFARVVSTNPEFSSFNDSNDLVLGEPGGGFTYVRRAQSTLPLARFIPSQSEITDMAFADVDGDNRLDFLFSQRSARAVGDEPLESLHVSFGSISKLIPTEPFLDLGDALSVDQILPILFEDTETPDGIYDFIVRTTTDEGPSALQFRGSLDRILQSPLDLPSVCLSLAGIETGAERLVAMGDFDGDASTDLAIVFRTPDGNVLYSATPTGSVSNAVCTSLAGPAPITLSDTDEARMAPVDLDGDGTQELAILSLVDGAETTLTLASQAGGEWTTTEVPLSGRFLGMKTTDLGLAGGLGDDLVLWTDEGVWILWNDGTGTLSTSNASYSPVTGVPCTDRGLEVTMGPPTAVAPAQLDAGVVRELLVASDNDTLSLSLNPETRALENPICASNLLRGGAAALLSDDVDGDGVDDLVVSRAGGTRVLAGIPVNP